MDSTAFGSPVAVQNDVEPLETERVGVGKRIVQRIARTSLFLEPATHSMHTKNQSRTPRVELLSKGRNIVAIGAVDNFNKSLYYKFITYKHERGTKK